MCLKNASTMALPHSYRAHKNHTLSGCISYATSAISPAHCLSLQWSHLRLQISQELYMATPCQYTLAFSLSVCMFSSFSLPFTFSLIFISFFYSRALDINVRSLTLVIMYQCPRGLGVTGLGECHVAFGL